MTIGFRSGSTKTISWVVAYDTGTLKQVGTIEFKTHDDRCLLNDVYVLPEFRGQGIATKLVHAMLDRTSLPYSAVRWGIRPDTPDVQLKQAFDRKFSKELP